MAGTSAYVLSTLARNWWALVLRGVIAIAFGLIAWLWPGLALYTLIVMFAVTAIVGGALSIVVALRSLSEQDRWIPLAAEGAIGIGAGLVALIWPDLTAKTFLYIIAFWAIISGVLEIASAVRLRKEISNEWLLGLTGLAGIIFGVVAMLRPLTGALAVLWLIGISSIFIGTLMVMLGLRLRGFPESQAGVSRFGVFGFFSRPSERTASIGAGRVESVDDSTSAGSAQSARIASEEMASDAGAKAPESTTTRSSNREAQTGQRLTRRERALQEIVKTLPPEGQGWVKGDGTTNAPDDYPYKGNVNSRIYHAPTGQSYHETVAELHFATAEDAERAGFRPRREPGGAAVTTPPTDEQSRDARASPVAASERVDESAAAGIVADVSGRTQGPHSDAPALPADGDTANIDYDDALVLEEAAGELGESEQPEDGFAPERRSADEESGETNVRAERDGATAEIDYDDALIIEEAGEDASATQDNDPVEEIDFDDQLIIEEVGASQASAGEHDADGDSDVGPDDQGTSAEAEESGEQLLEAGSGKGVDPTARTEIPEPGATLVDNEGIGIASALDVEVADTEDAEADQAAPEDAPRNVEIITTNAASENVAVEIEHVATDAEEETAAAIREESETAVKPRHEQALDEIIADLSPEGEGWLRGLGGYETPAGYPVKGNASSRLFHMPGGRNYAATIPEICFATPEDAISAGFRPRSGDPIDLDLTQVVEAESSAAHGIRASAPTEPEPVDIQEPNGIGRELAEMLESLPPEGNGWIRGMGGYETPAGYPVKGNASSKLYHMPGGRNYAATISEINFATPDDALRAGFRPRSGDPTEIDQSLVQEIVIPASLGIRASAPDEAEDDPWASLIASLPPEGSGWVRGDGGRDCPGEFPVKGNASSRIYHLPTGGSYEATIPEVCFATPDDAGSAGFRAAKN